jgi:hypothetical protein
LLQAIIDLQEKIKRGGTLTGVEFDQRNRPEGPPPFDKQELQRRVLRQELIARGRMMKVNPDGTERDRRERAH